MHCGSRSSLLEPFNHWCSQAPVRTCLHHHFPRSLRLSHLFQTWTQHQVKRGRLGRPGKKRNVKGKRGERKRPQNIDIEIRGTKRKGNARKSGINHDMETTSHRTRAPKIAEILNPVLQNTDSSTLTEKG